MLTSTVTGAGTVFYTPYRGNRISMYNTATNNWTQYTFPELSITLSALSASTAYDVFAYVNNGAIALETVAWTNATTRAVGLQFQHGVRSRSPSGTRYLGSFITDANKQCQVSFGSLAANGGAAQVDIWNENNRVAVTMMVGDTTDQWNYTSPSWRSVNGSNSNRVTMFMGISEEPVQAYAMSISSNTGAVVRYVGIGLDSTTAASGLIGSSSLTTSSHPISAAFGAVMAVGQHYLQWLEKSVATNTSTWFGDNNGDRQTGLIVTWNY